MREVLTTQQQGFSKMVTHSARSSNPCLYVADAELQKPIKEFRHKELCYLLLQNNAECCNSVCCI